MPKSFHTQVDSAPSFWADGGVWTVVASADDTDGQCTIQDQLMPEGSGAPPHLHERYEEGFYLIDGDIRFQVGEDIVTAGPGSFVWIPRGTPHAFRVLSKTARALNFYTPGGFDEQTSMLFPKAPGRVMPEPSASGSVRARPGDAGAMQAFVDRIRDLHTQTGVDVPNLVAGDASPSATPRSAEPVPVPHTTGR